jgi:hypothetical protein
MSPDEPNPQSDLRDGADGSRRQVTAIELAERQGVISDPRGSLIPSLTAVFEQILQNPSGSAETTHANDLYLALIRFSASATAVSAVEGTLPQKTIDGALKEALIEQAFAAAARDRAESKQIELETAWKQVQNTLATLQGLGISPRLARLPDGRPALTLGDGLDIPLPGFEPAVEQQQTVAVDHGVVPPQRDAGTYV